MPSVITVENLSKKYIIGHQKHERDATLRDALASGTKRFANRLRHPFSTPVNDPEHEEFWALRDVTFEVKRGERVGIIGRNGAGKSTLLKILSRITEPTQGRARIYGRVASLLEVGTGFHPELSGRENIFLNGTILGMSRREIQHKFDEIVAFAEVERFLDVPVKRYSSGMYVRLAFAVAAHLQTDIMIIDEVLAVGDMQFQNKCLGKMEEIGNEGHTVLFVSHNMSAIEKLCQTGILLSHGQANFRGPVTDAIEAYMDSYPTSTVEELGRRTDRAGRGAAKITRLIVAEKASSLRQAISSGAKLEFTLDYEAELVLHRPRLVIGVYDRVGTGIFRLDTDISGLAPPALDKCGRIVCATEPANMTPGRYFVNIALYADSVLEDYIQGAVAFDVVCTDYFGTGRTFDEADSKLMKMLIRHEWTFIN